MEHRLEERMGMEWGGRPRDVAATTAEQPTDFERRVNKCPVCSGRGALTLAVRHACIRAPEVGAGGPDG